MRIAFVGNPNSGKTTMFNVLSGKNERVGNWGGVTVDKREASIKKTYAENDDIIAVDLPGAYSMSPFTSEEAITSSFIKRQNVDVIINIVDATNLSRSLFFTTQLLDLGIPVVIALNKNDINEKKGTKINKTLLSQKLNCPVIFTTSTENNGLDELIKAAISVRNQKQLPAYKQEKINLKSKEKVEEADRKRYAFVNKIVAEVEERKILTKERNFQDKIDDIVTHKVFGVLIFGLIMFLVFHISQSEGAFGIGKILEGKFTGLIEIFQEIVEENLGDVNPVLQALLIDGIIGGVSAVVGFLPLVMTMYFLIALLEDCGYMARASVLLDPIFKKVGLSGRSVIPFVIGTGCAIPAVMSCRTIRNEREKRLAAMLTPFMPCGAKLPVIALFSGAFFSGQSWVGTSMYFVGIILIFFGALLINKIVGYKYRKSFFIIELPEYKIPSLKLAVFSMLQRGWAYIVKAGTIILLCNTVVQLMKTFTLNFTVAEDPSQSILALISSPISYLLIPIVGVASWQLAAAAVTGFIAKENVVGTLAVCFVGLNNFIDLDENAMLEGSANEIAQIVAITKVAALAYLMFNLYTPPCFAALGAMNSEISNKKWFYGGILLQFTTGFIIAFVVYQLGTFITTGAFGPGFLAGLVFLILVVIVISSLIRYNNKKLLENYKI